MNNKININWKQVENYVTLYNLFNFIVIFGLYINMYHIDGMDKKEIIQNIKHTCNQILGEERNKNYGIYYITFYHYTATISSTLGLFLANDVKNYFFNFILISFIGYTNLIFKGCILRKYERELLNGEDSYVSRLINSTFSIYFSLTNTENTIKNKVTTVFYFFTSIYIILGLKMVYLLRKQKYI